MLTIVKITFNFGSKQYTYLFEGNKQSLNKNQKYKIIKGVNNNCPIYDIIIIKDFYEVEEIPQIVTSLFQIKDNGEAKLSKIPYQTLVELRNTSKVQIETPKQIITKHNNPEAPTNFIYAWRVYVDNYNKYKYMITKTAKTDPMYVIYVSYVLLYIEHFIRLLTKWDCSKFFKETQVFNLNELIKEKENLCKGE